MPLAGEASPPTDPARPALMLLVASAFELMASVVLCSTGTCDGLNAYAVSVGAVSTCLSIAVLAALRHDDAFPSVVLDLLPHTAAFLLVWWLFGWLVLTFVRPFAGLCNGFFACWAALVAAIWLVRALLPTPIANEPSLAPDAPEEGAVVWRMGLFKCADDSPNPHWGAWADIGERLDFHQPDKFGSLLLRRATRTSGGGVKRARL